MLKFIQRLAYIYILSIYLSVIFPGTFLQTLYRKFSKVVLGVLAHVTLLIFFSRIRRSEALVYS